MFFVPVMWPDYEFAGLTPSGRAAIGLTVSKRVRLLVREADGRGWRVVREWPVDRLSHTDIMVHLGRYPEPESAEDILALIARLEGGAPTDPRTGS